MKKITLFTLFSGYESQFMALLLAVLSGFNQFMVDLVGWSDNDPRVRAIHNLLFPEYADRCYPDVTTIDWDSNTNPAHVLIYSSPCQAVSRAGKRKGLKKNSGTTSSLIWSVEKAIATMRPKWCIMENVEGMLDPQNLEDFNSWIRTLSSYGYESFYKVISSADHGIPQNRRRVILISRRIDEGEHIGDLKRMISDFFWPKAIQLTKKPEDLLSKTVEDKYYLTQEETETYLDLMVNAKHGYISRVTYKGQYPTKYLTSQFDGMVQSFVTPLCKNGTIPTLMANSQGGNLATMAGCRREACPCVVEVWQGRQGLEPIPMTDAKIGHQKVKALRECKDRERVIGALKNLKEGQYLRVRRLTPEESLRFMGVEDKYINRMLHPYETLTKEGYTDEDIDKLMTIDGKKVKLTDSTIYGRAGNSIVVNVLKDVFTSILKYESGQIPLDTIKPVVADSRLAEQAQTNLKAFYKAEAKREAQNKYQREYYKLHREEVCKKSCEWHKADRIRKKEQASKVAA